MKTSIISLNNVESWNNNNKNKTIATFQVEYGSLLIQKTYSADYGNKNNDHVYIMNTK